jgi:hypothetical protein
MPALSLVKPEHNSKEWQENDHTIAKVREFLSYCPADYDYEQLHGCDKRYVSSLIRTFRCTGRY